MPRSEQSGEQQAQQRFGSTARAAVFHANQVLDHLNTRMQAFIARQEMLFIATANAAGACDCSFRAGTPGFVHVLGEKSLAYPEYRGNGVFASLGNLIENPRIGMIFLDFEQSTVGLHVNGQARILSPGEIQSLTTASPAMVEAAQTKGGRRPEAWVLVTVEEAYIHCSKHVPLMKRLDKRIAWGTDDESFKGGDFFKARR
jgi:predicted pyridoxine 5'-phosphate oxidase superfamily flavin-nucleotide-binding protein